MEEITIIDITAGNAAKEGLFCLRNPANPGFGAKVSWLAARRKEGLRLRVLKVDGEAAGFIEYVPAENAWRPVEEMKEMARAHGLELQVTLLRSAEEAQHSPSGYGVYSLVFDGRVLADHYISNTRFSNILKKEL